MTGNAGINTDAAQAYETLLVPALNSPLALEIVEAAAVRPGERVLDVACGTGLVARLLAPRLERRDRIAGLDIDPAMIAVARALGGPHDGAAIDWHCASALEMPFEPATFDVALCLQGLQYFPDCLAGLSEIRRVLKTPGRFVAAVWTNVEDCKGQFALARALERRNVDAAAIRKAYSFGDPERIRALAREAGFSMVDTRVSAGVARFPSVRGFVEAFAAGSLSSRAAISKVPESEREQFLNDVENELLSYVTDDGAALPLGYLVLTARV